MNKEDVDPFEAIIEEVKHAKGVKLDNELASSYQVVIAKDEDPARENKNMSLWLIPSDTPGVSTAALDVYKRQSCS